MLRETWAQKVPRWRGLPRTPGAGRLTSCISSTESSSWDRMQPSSWVMAQVHARKKVASPASKPTVRPMSSAKLPGHGDRLCHTCPAPAVSRALNTTRSMIAIACEGRKLARARDAQDAFASLDSKHHLSTSAPHFQVAHGCRSVVQDVASVDDWRYFSCAR